MRGPRSLLRASVVLSMALGVAPAAGAATFTLSGVVRNEAGIGVANADIDLIDVCTGQNVFLVNDKTLANGAFSVVANAATYDVHFTPPAGSTLAAASRNGVALTSNVNLGVTTLRAGRGVTGVVRDAAATGIPGVHVDFVDVATGERLYVPANVTDAAGNYGMRVPSGTYDVEYRPPSGTPYVTGLRPGLVVSSAVLGLVDTLVQGAQVSGTVLDARGQPIRDADLNFTDLCSGAIVPTAHDNTDATGAFSVVVAPATYSIRVAAPACRALATEVLSDRAVGGPTALGTVQLRDAVPVTGRALDPAGQPVPNADLNFFDATTGSRQGTSRDNTDAGGAFSVYVPSGLYDVDLRPPVSRDLLLVRVQAVSVTGPTSVGDQLLPAGIPVTGKALGPGGSAQLNVDVDAVDSATGAALRLAHSHTAADGSFRVVVPQGTFDFRFIPPACSTLAPAQVRSVEVTSASTIPTVTLAAGFRVSGLVRDASSAPVPDVDLDFFLAGSSTQVFSARDNTDATGAFSTVVPPGTYDVRFTAPSAAGLSPAIRRGVVVGADLTLPVTTLFPAGSLGIASVNPASGSTAGGVLVSLGGTGFQQGATVQFGKETSSSVTVTSGSALTAKAPPHPAGFVDVVVIDPTGQMTTRPAAFQYREPATPIALTVRRVGNDVVLSWPATGQASYTVFRGGSPTDFGDASILAVTPGTGYTDVGAALRPGTLYYGVD